MTQNKILVTGGAGFIGRRVCKQLAEQGKGIISVDNLFTGIENPKSTSLISHYPYSILNRPSLEKIFSENKIEGVIHLAAIHHIPTCEQKPALALESNIIGTQNILDLMLENNVLNLVMASSGAVYDWSDASLREDSSLLKAHDVYSITKLANEQQAAVWSKKSNGLVSAARIFNTIGHDDPNGHLIPDILQQIPAGSSDVKIQLGNTKPKRDYVHADDTARAITGLYNNIRKQTVGFDAYNICSGEEHSVAALVDIISKILDVNIAIETDPSRIRKIDRLSQLGDNNKLLQHCNWKPESSFYQAIEKTVKKLL